VRGTGVHLAGIDVAAHKAIALITLVACTFVGTGASTFTSGKLGARIGLAAVEFLALDTVTGVTLNASAGVGGRAGLGAGSEAVARSRPTRVNLVAAEAVTLIAGFA